MGCAPMVIDCAQAGKSDVKESNQRALMHPVIVIGFHRMPVHKAVIARYVARISVEHQWWDLIKFAAADTRRADILVLMRSR